MSSVSPSQSIEQQQKSIMMKKLLFAVCRNYWENDHRTLSQIKVEALVIELYESQPTLASVKDKLTEVVDGLNKREKYYPISNLLMKKISKLYGDPVEPASDLTSPPAKTQEITMLAPSTLNHIIPKIVQSFEQEENYQRIHKVLFALYARRWENSQQILSNYPLSYLIQEIYRKYSHLEEISINLLKIVKGLNKQGTYSQVAQIVIKELANLYQEETNVEQLQSLVEASRSTIKQAKANQTGFLEKTTAATRKHNFNYDPCEVRRQVMKMANPLRAKMLLYYLLNPEQNNEPTIDHFVLKTYELDQMLLQAVQKFKTLTKLQKRLEATVLELPSNTHQILKNVDENFSVAKAIIISLKPLYESS